MTWRPPTQQDAQQGGREGEDGVQLVGELDRHIPQPGPAGVSMLDEQPHAEDIKIGHVSLLHACHVYCIHILERSSIYSMV